MLYKYRDLDNFRFFVDIILNNRFYAAPYTDLNDPMEGYYRYTTGDLSDEVLKSIKGEKKKLGICSLSRNSKIELMWSHYCDGHKGIVIGVEIHDNYDIQPINYDGLPHIQNQNNLNYEETARAILTNKHQIWTYEEETRVFVEGAKYINVEVKEVILGEKMDSRTKGFIRSLVEKINPNIEIINASIYNLEDAD